jgi:hypothetical protein
MSAEHRKPLAAFILLALAAAVIVGVQRADAQPGRFLASVVGSTERVHGLLPELTDSSAQLSGSQLGRLGPAFGAVIAHERRVHDRAGAERASTPAKGGHGAPGQAKQADASEAASAPGQLVAEVVRRSEDHRSDRSTEAVGRLRRPVESGVNDGLHGSTSSRHGFAKDAHDRDGHVAFGHDAESTRDRHHRHGR